MDSKEDEYRHRSRNHQLGACLYRSRRRRAIRLPFTSRKLRSTSRPAAWKLCARCLRSFSWAIRNTSAPTRANKARWFPPSACIRPKAGSRTRRWTAPRRFCRGTRRRAAASFRPWKSPREILKHLAERVDSRQHALAHRPAQRRAHSARKLRRGGARINRRGGARSRHRATDAFGRTCRGVLFLGGERSDALAEKSCSTDKPCWCAMSAAAPATSR